MSIENMSPLARIKEMRSVLETLQRLLFHLEEPERFRYRFDELALRADVDYLSELLDPEILCPMRGRPKQQPAPPAPVIHVVYKEVIREIAVPRQAEYDELPAPQPSALPTAQHRPRLTLRMPSREQS